MKTNMKIKATITALILSFNTVGAFAVDSVEKSASVQPVEMSFLEALSLGNRYVPMGGIYREVRTGPNNFFGFIKENLAMMARGNATVPMGGIRVPGSDEPGQGLTHLKTALNLAGRGSVTIPLAGATIHSKFPAPTSKTDGPKGGRSVWTSLHQLMKMAGRGAGYAPLVGYTKRD